jgi:UDP-N-acetylmuramate: L-alanyl-gamma-D-glutamyl-meso-diaminopimelate ligase
MRKVFQGVYPDAFADADVVCIRKPPLLSKIRPEDRFSSEKLVQDLVDGGKEALYFEDTEAIIEYLADTTKPDDVVFVMSNGGFDNIHERLLERL